MAQPNVSREPSMEEILASIRRIIESNDPVVGKDMSPIYAGDDDLIDEELSVDEARELSFMLEAANDKAPAPAISVPEMRMAAAVAPAAPVVSAHNGMGGNDQARPQQKSISLADLAARVRAAADRGEGMGQRPVAAPQEPVQSPVMTGRMAELRNTIAPEPAPVVEQPVQRQERAIVPEQRQQAEYQAQPEYKAQSDYQSMGAELQAALDTAARHAPTMSARDVMPQVREEMIPVAELDAQQDQSRGLISVMAGQQIARSFDELAAAIDGTQRRTLDEMAEEMLRPMLQDWLDDNLPTLVERLVREEIERVARGPRR